MSKWEMVKIEDVCDILDNQRIPITASDRIAGIYPYYGANGVQDYIDKYIFDDELVLLAEDGGNFGSKDKPIAYRVSGKCWVNNHAHVLKPKSMLDVDYLCYSLMFYDVSDIVNGTTRQKLNQAAMRKMTIPLPPLPIQKHIADVLDRAARLRELRRQQLDKMDLLIKSKFIDMFGDPIINSKKLPETTFINIVKLQRGFDLPIGVRNINGLVPVYGSNGILGYHDKAKVQNGGIITGRSGTIGKVYYASSDYWPLNTTLFSVELNGNNLIFLANLLELYDLSRFAEGTGVPTLNRNNIHNEKIISIPLPLQLQFADFVARAEEQKSAMRRGLEGMEMNCRALMQGYFG